MTKGQPLPEKQRDQDVLDRLATLETTSNHQAAAVRGLDAKVDRGFTDLNTRLDQIVKQQAERERTPWTVLLSTAGVILALVRFGSDSYIRDIDDLKFQQAKIETVVREHKELPGHDVTIHRLNDFINTVGLTTGWTDDRLDVIEEVLDSDVHIDHYDRYIHPVLIQLQQRLREIESTRSTSADKQKTLDHIADLRERLGIVEATVNETRREQLARTQKVYDGK